MDQHNLNFEQTLDESKMLLDDASRVADEDYEFTLESILAEFGGEQSAPDVELSAPKPAVSIVPNLADLPQDDEDEAPEEPDDGDGMPDDIVPALDTPQSYSLQQVLERTVQEVLDEQKSEPVLEEQPSRRGLFSRKKLVETEELYDTPPAKPRQAEEAEEPDEPEPPITDTLADYRAAMQNAKQVARFSALITILMWVPQVLAHFGLMPALYSEERLLNTFPYFVALALVCVLGREVFFYAVEKLTAFKVTYELLTALLCVAALGDNLRYLRRPLTGS